MKKKKPQTHHFFQTLTPKLGNKLNRVERTTPAPTKNETAVETPCGSNQTTEVPTHNPPLQQWSVADHKQNPSKQHGSAYTRTSHEVVRYMSGSRSISTAELGSLKSKALSTSGCSIPNDPSVASLHSEPPSSFVISTTSAHLHVVF